MKIKRRPKVEEIELGRIFFVPFLNSDKGVFGYVKYSASRRTNPRSFGFSMCDIYDRICKFDDWSEDIKHEKIRIYDHIVNAGDFYKTRHNIKPMLLTDQYTNIIHPVKYGFFRIGSKKYWYDADAEDIVYPDDESQYRRVEMWFPPYEQLYMEAIFNGENIKYGDPIPGIDYGD